jgi:hypothetical protein
MISPDTKTHTKERKEAGRDWKRNIVGKYTKLVSPSQIRNPPKHQNVQYHVLKPKM